MLNQHIGCRYQNRHNKHLQPNRCFSYTIFQEGGIHTDTFQDFKNTEEILEFIIKAINSYKQSIDYKKAIEAQEYYRNKNIAILKRLTYLQKHGLLDSKVKFHKLCSGFFPKLIKQLSQYLLGNGVTLPQDVKNKLGIGFDKTLQKAGLQALVDGVNWGFWNVDNLVIFRATEFVPLLDEENGNLRAGIRFWQIDSEKPMHIVLYEEDGITKYKYEDSELTPIDEKQSYITKKRTDILGSKIEDTENYSTLPIFPLYANELKQSELTDGLLGMIDAYDYINSDLADGITQIEGLYKIIKNFGGEDAIQLINEIQQLKATATEDELNGVDFEIVEIPYQAKKIALDLLKKQIYDDFMALNTESIAGGSLTNVAINTAKTDLDLKTDLFEWQCADFVHNILKLLGIENKEATFKRRSITNDTENINNISTMLMDGYIDKEEAIFMNPMILESRQKDLMDRLALQEAGIPPEDEELDDDDVA